MRLRHFLTLMFFAIALIPIAVFRFWPISALQETEISAAHAQQTVLAKTLSSALSLYHRNISDTFTLLAATPELWNSPGPVSRSLNDTGLSHICIADGQTGAILYRAGRESALCSTRLSDVLLEKADTDGRLGVRLSAMSPAESGRHTLHLSQHLSDGRIAFGALRTGVFAKVGQTTSFGNNGYVVIADHAGNILFHPNAEKAAPELGQLSATLRSLKGLGGDGRFQSPLFGTEMIAGLANVPSAGWDVFVAQPISDLRLQTNGTRAFDVFILCIGLICAVVFSYFISLLAGKEIEKIGGSVRQISGGASKQNGNNDPISFLPTELGDLYRDIQDLSRQVQANRSKTRNLVRNDPLTLLANRESFRRRLVALMKQADPQNNGFLLMIDLDGFKAINEAMGSETADDVLRHVAKLIASVSGSAMGVTDRAIRSTALQTDFDTPMAARLAGDEFAVFLPNSHDDDAIRLSTAILNAISAPFFVGKEKLRVGASIGIAQYPMHGRTFSDLLQSADHAICDAKRSGKNQIRHYSPDLKSAHEATMRLGPELAEGFAQGQFEIHFQPVYDAQDFKISNLETFLRWKHPKFGLLEAADFLEAAKHFGLQGKVDMFIFDQTLAMVNDMAMRGALVPAVSINFWMDSFANQKLVNHMIDNIPQFPCPVTFELINSNASSRQRALWGLDRVRDAGVDIALDDFGAVSGSISGLIELQPTSIKIDGTLTRLIGDDPRRAKLLASIVEMAHSQNIRVGAKGIETLGQVEALRALGCDFVQGRALNGPMPYEDLVTCLIDTSSKAPPQRQILPPA